MKTFVPVTYDCNDNCISCPVPRRQNKDNPSFKDIKKEIDEILETSNHIEINGGEPTLSKDLLKILRYIEKKNPDEIGLLTNAQYFYYEDYSRNVSKIKNLKIITTLYGHNPKIHDATTRTPGSFEHKIIGIKNLIKYKVPIELRILLHKMNYKYFNDIVKFLVSNFNKEDFNKIIIMNPKLTERAEENKKVVAEKLTRLAEVLEEPVKKLIKNGYKVEIYHFPHCVLPKNLWEYSKGLTADDKEVTFTEKCKTCLKKEKCSRIWKSYLDIFGSDEFNPEHKTTKNFYLKLYYNKDKFIKTKKIYKYFKVNNIPVADYSFYHSDIIKGSEGFSLCKYHKTKITLEDYYVKYGISDMDNIFGYIIEILDKIHNLPTIKSLWINPLTMAQKRNIPNYVSKNALMRITRRPKKQTYESKRVIFGDFNIPNIILTDKENINYNDIFLIDLDEVCVGDSLIDISKLLFYCPDREFADLFLKKYMDKKKLDRDIITEIIVYQLNFIDAEGIIIHKRIKDYINHCFEKRLILIHREIYKLERGN